MASLCPKLGCATSDDPLSILTIDGGFATQLTKHVGSRVDGDPLWSARFNATNPQAVMQTHLDFLRAGAQVILTNTYQASIAGYGRHLDLSPDASRELIRSTVRLAHDAKRKYITESLKTRGPEMERLPWIVASIGPYGAHLNDGSEYTGDYADSVTAEAIKQFHRERLRAVRDGGVEALAIETIPCQKEADAVVELLAQEFPELPYWLSFQCNVDGVHLAHGEVFAEVARRIWEQEESRGKLLAVGMNCLNPELVAKLLKALNAGRNSTELIPSVVYPNSGELYTAGDGWTGINNCNKKLHEYVPEWMDLGAHFIGGCCRTNANDIQDIRAAVDKKKGVKKAK